MNRSKHTSRHELLVVCGEPSGDLMAAEVLARLATPAFGIGGPELRGVGLDSVTPMEQLSGMGSSAARKLVSLGLAWRLLRKQVQGRAPRAALLVGFSEFNARLGLWLRERGVRVVWYAPPQFWAWRRGRGPRLVGCADQFALILPFEEALWRALSARASYVGHPALSWRADDIPRQTGRIAVLPGSRPEEVARLWPLQHKAIRQLARLRPDWSFEVSISPGLPPPTRTALARSARRAGLTASQEARAVLARAEFSICCSGTATLQSALCGCPPLIAYPLSRVAEAALRRLVRVRHIGLPNLVLDRRAFPELVGQAVQPSTLSDAALELATNLQEQREHCTELETRLSAGLEHAPAQNVARLVERYL